MRDLSRGAYPLEKREVVMEGKDLRVSVLTLAPGQCVPWHYHSQVADAFICLEGPMVVETRAPREARVLQAGESCTVPPMTAHYVHGLDDGRCRFVIVQGVGDYDFRAVGGG
jgi:quercetin dioxygenase-like cupin family protein